MDRQRREAHRPPTAASCPTTSRPRSKPSCERSLDRRPASATVVAMPTSTPRSGSTRTSRTCSARSTGRTLDGLRVVLDCANGAAFELGPRALRAAGRRRRRAARRARRPQHQRRVRVDASRGAAGARCVEHGADLGLALDGDADRVLAVDEHGELVDGDQIMVMTALDLARARHAAQRRDRGDRDVEPRLAARAARRRASTSSRRRSATATSLAAMRRARPRARRRAVGPHRVRATSRPPATACSPACSSPTSCAGRAGPLSALAAQMTRFPQVLVNVPVSRAASISASATAVREAGRARSRPSSAIAGRVLVRASGTEPVVRVMVEAPTESEAEAAVARLRRAVEIAFAGRSTLTLDRQRSFGGTAVCAESSAVVRRPSDRRGARAARRSCGTLDAADGAPRGTDRGRPTRTGSTTVARGRRRRRRVRCAARDGSRALLADPVALGRARAPRRRTARRTLAAIEATLDTRPSPTATRDRGAERRARRVQGRGVGARSGPPAAPRGRSRTSPAARPSTAPRARRVPLDPGRAVGARPARGARPRLRRPARARHRPRARPRRPDDRAPPRERAYATRCSRRGSVRVADGHLAFVYKTAAEIGELGDNTARSARADPRRRAAAPRAARRDGARPSVLAHTRWASVGIISEAERAPAEPGGARPARARAVRRRPRSTATSTTTPTSRRSRRCDFPAEITTDAKVIPALVSRRLDERRRARSRRSARRSPSFEGSVAIAAQSAAEPGRVLLAQRGSGQALYVGLARRRVRRRERAVRRRRGVRPLPPPRRRDDARPGQPRDAGPDRGARRGARARSRDRAAVVRRPRAAGDRGRAAARPRSRPATSTAATLRTTCSRRSTEAPGVVPQDAARPASSSATGASTCASRPRRCPPTIVERLRAGDVPARARHRAGHRGDRRAEPRARAARRTLAGRSHRGRSDRRDRALGFGLARRHARHARASRSRSRAPRPTRTAPSTSSRHAARSVIAIVNRRQSDLVDKSDGVLYTSDGRDVEMSVASTKAFYAQLAAGFLLAFALAARARRRRRRRPRRTARRCSARCASCPTRCARCSSAGPRSRVAAQRHALSPPVVGGRRQRRQPGRGRRRCASSSRSSVTSRSRATSPRTRSTSTSRPSR